MASTDTGGINEFARLLSLEPFPLKPMLDPKDIVKTENNLRLFHEQLERYLKRLTGKFQEFGGTLNQYITNQITNVTTLIGTAGFINKIEKHYTYASKPSTTTTTTVDSSIDWRGYVGVFSLRVRDVVSDPGSNLVNDLSTAGRTTDVLNCVTIAASYPLTLLSAGAAIISGSLKVSSTGVLQLVVVQSPAAGTAYIDVFAAALHLVPTEAASGAISI